MAQHSLPTVRLATPDGTVVCEQCEVALTAIARPRHSFDRQRAAGTEGALLRKPASWTHTLFRHDSVDVVFLDADLRVVRLIAHVPPGRVVACSGARALVTLPADQVGRHNVHLGLRLVSNPTAAT